MPLYEYKCPECGTHEEIYCRLSERPTQVPCPAPGCSGFAHQIVAFRGGLKTEHPNWLDDSVRWALQTEAERRKRPIQTRSDWERTLKEKNLVPVG